jgi:GNAT superfamily N-acetyltransferase
MTGEVIVRPAVIGDAQEIAHLSGQLGYPVAGEVMAQRLGRTLARNDQLLLIADIGGKVGGWLQAQSAEIIESGFRVEIVGLIIDENMRRRGVGRRLVQEIERWAASLGAQAVVVRTNISRAESHIFYGALGYPFTKTQHVYRKVLNKPEEPGA